MNDFVKFLGAAVAAVAMTVGMLYVETADADRLMPGDCRVQTEDYNGETRWWAWDQVETCEAGIHRGEVHIEFHDARKVTQFLGEEVIKVIFKPVSARQRGLTHP